MKKSKINVPQPPTIKGCFSGSTGLQKPSILIVKQVMTLQQHRENEAEATARFLAKKVFNIYSKNIS